METGEYHGFAGRFSCWLRAQFAAWRWPLLLSLLLHAALFWPAGLQQSRSGASTGMASGLHARLRPAPELPVLAVVAPAPVAATQSAPVRRRDDRLPPPVPTVAPAAAALNHGSSPATALPRELAEAIHAGPAAGGVDAGALRTYRLALARAIRADMLRPRLPDPAFQGALALGIAVGAAGQVQAVTVLRGSGSASVDAAVLDAVSEAARAATVPAAMRGRDFVIELSLEIGPALTAAAGR